MSMHAKTDSEGHQSNSLISDQISPATRLLRPEPIPRLPRRRENHQLLPLHTRLKPQRLARSPLTQLILHPLFGSLRPGSRKHSQPLQPRKGTKGFDAIEEEGLIDDDHRSGIPRRCYFLAFVVGFFVLFSFFALVLWAAARPQKPDITMRSISFDEFVVNAGADASGVATEMVNLNATIRFNFRNRGTFFGVHVSSTPVDLAYTELTLASGTIKKFYESRKGHKLVSVNLHGRGVPLYGGGVNWSSQNGKLTAPVPLNLNFTVKAKAYVLGKLVKPKFHRKVSCAIVYKPTKVNVPISLKNSCTVE